MFSHPGSELILSDNIFINVRKASGATDVQDCCSVGLQAVQPRLLAVITIIVMTRL